MIAAAALAGCILAATLSVPVHVDGAHAVADRPAQADRRSVALAAADEFLDRYLQPSGRIARHDQGGDTVSEGQAYGMLAAVALGDESRFRQLWLWTDEQLQRGDGLFAWRWADGRRVDDNAATDADLLIAAALALGSRRFDDPELRDQARRVSDAILSVETITLGDRRVLVAGNWAGSWRMINASYLVTPAMSVLWEILPEYRWGEVAWTSRLLLAEMMDTGPHLPPDWAVVDERGLDPQAVPSPSGQSARYSYDAGRVIVQTAVDCRAAGQRLAARTWPFFRDHVDARTLVMPYTLDGAPLGDDRHALAMVAAAGAAAASGHRARADELLAAAERRDDANPTYFGAAWVALGRLWLDTDLIGGCRPGAPGRGLADACSMCRVTRHIEHPSRYGTETSGTRQVPEHPQNAAELAPTLAGV